MASQFNDMHPHAIVRIWLPAQVKAQYAGEESALIQSSSYIESCRQQLATSVLDKKSSLGFRKGFSILMENGFIKD